MFLFRMMPAAQHCPEVRSCRLANGAQVDVHHHKDREDEAGDDMQQVGEMQTAGPKNFLCKNHFGIDHGKAGNDDHGHKKIQDSHIAYFLKRVEFTLGIEWIRSFFSFKYTEHIIPALCHKLR